MESQKVTCKPVNIFPSFPGKRQYGMSLLSVVNVKPFTLSLWFVTGFPHNMGNVYQKFLIAMRLIGK